MEKELLIELHAAAKKKVEHLEKIMVGFQKALSKAQADFKKLDGALYVENKYSPFVAMASLREGDPVALVGTHGVKPFPLLSWYSQAQLDSLNEKLSRKPAKSLMPAFYAGKQIKPAKPNPFKLPEL